MRKVMGILGLGMVLMWGGLVVAAEPAPKAGEQKVKKTESDFEKATRKMKLASKKRTEAAEWDAKNDKKKATALRVEANKLENEAAQLETNAKRKATAPGNADQPAQ